MDRKLLWVSNGSPIEGSKADWALDMLYGRPRVGYSLCTVWPKTSSLLTLRGVRNVFIYQSLTVFKCLRVMLSGFKQNTAYRQCIYLPGFLLPFYVCSFSPKTDSIYFKKKNVGTYQYLKTVAKPPQAAHRPLWGERNASGKGATQLLSPCR